MISLARLSDLFLDPRMPYFLPYLKLKRRSKTLSNVDVPDKPPLLMALTFDVEYDFGSSAREASLNAVEPFLQQLPALAEEWQAAFDSKNYQDELGELYDIIPISILVFDQWFNF